MSSSDIKKIAKRYAKALFGLTKTKDLQNKTEKDLNALVTLIEKDNKIRKFLFSPIANKNDLEIAITEVAKSLKIQETSKQFLLILLKEKRLSLLQIIAEQYFHILMDERGEKKIFVTTAKKLSKKQEKEIEDSFGKLLDKKVLLTQEIDESIIGGIIVKAGSELYDYSVEGKLNKIQETLEN